MKKVKINLITQSAMAGALAVVLGAFGAHAFKEHLISIGRLDTFDTAVRYHFYHSLAMLAAAILYLQFGHQMLRRAAAFFLVGIIFFSGSLYVLSTGYGLRFLGFATPLGGVFFIVGWILLAIWGVRVSSDVAERREGKL